MAISLTDPVWLRAFRSGALCALAGGLVARWSPEGLWLGAPLVGVAAAYSLVRALQPLRARVEALPVGRDARPHKLDLQQLAERVGASRERVGEVLSELRQERNDLNAILRATADGVLVLDSEQRAVLVNEAAYRILGLPVDALGRRLTELVRNLELFEFVERLAAGQDVEPLQLTLAWGLGRRALRITGSPLHDGVQRRMLLVMHDVTDLQHLERVRTDFVTNVTHEMRSPLASILGFAETLVDDAEHVGSEVSDAAERILRNARRLDDIVRDLVQLSRLEHATAPSLEPTDVAGLIKEVVQAHADTAGEKEISLEVRCDGLPSRLEVDRLLLRQALVNLVENAVKYTGERGHVRVEACAGEGTLQMSVVDTGPGIPAEHRDRVFERFYRVDTARSRSMGGTGLGLAIVKHAAAVHGGTVRLESEVGVGTRFELRFPTSDGIAPGRGAGTTG
jgi:two-component system phosphate regulon sensor histidine kinase PhoR